MGGIGEGGWRWQPHSGDSFGRAGGPIAVLLEALFQSEGDELSLSLGANTRSCHRQ